MFFRKPPKIEYQIENFITYKRMTKGWSTSINHREWLAKFVAVTHINDVHSLSSDHADYFIDWVVGHYPTEYAKLQALNTLRCFFRFYKRYDIIVHMTKLGRKPNYEMIGIVKGMRNQNPPVPFRTITQTLTKKTKKKIYDKSVWRWANAKI